MGELTIEQQKALALAQARRRREEEQGNVIGTTEYGGRFVELPDGSTAFRSPGYNTNDPKEVQRLLDGATPADIFQSKLDQDTVSRYPGLGEALETAQGIPLVGEWLDEGMDAIAPGAGGRMRTLSSAMERERPGRSTALNVTGGVAATAPIAVAGAAIPIVSKTAGAVGNFVRSASSPVGRAIRSGLVALPAGAAEGAASFAGRAAEGERGDAAALGAGVGAGLGATLGLFAPMLGDSAAALARRIKRLDVREIADVLNVSQPSARIIKGYLQNDDLDAAVELINRSGDETMLAEAGPGTRQALDTAMASGGGALSTARPRVDARVQNAASRWQETLNSVMGTAEGGIKGESRRISQSSARARSEAYDFAYSQPTPMTGAGGRAIEDALALIEPGSFDAILREAAAEARVSGFPNLNIKANIDDAGNVTFEKPLSVLELDYLARGLGNIVENGTDPMTGQMSPAARRASIQARAIRDALKDNVDGYARALQLGGDKIRDTNALVLGRRAFNPSTTVEDVRDAMRGASQSQREAARRGARESIEAIMGKARTSIADLEAGNLDFDTGLNDVAQAVAAFRKLTEPDNRRKLTFILGSGSDTTRLFKELQRMSDALVLRAAVARGSATAIRQSGQQAIESEAAPGLVRSVGGNLGGVTDASRAITQKLAGIDPANISAEQSRYLAEIANALTSIQGDDAKRAITAVQNAMRGQPLRDEEAQLVGRLIAAGSATGLFRGGSQSTRPQ